MLLDPSLGESKSFLFQNEDWAAALAFALTLHYNARVVAFAPSKSSISLRHQDARSKLAVLASPTEEAAVAADDSSSNEDIDLEMISKLSFRELQRECKSRGLPAMGNTAALRSQLRKQVIPSFSGAEDGEGGAELSKVSSVSCCGYDAVSHVDC